MGYTNWLEILYQNKSLICNKSRNKFSLAGTKIIQGLPHIPGSMRNKIKIIADISANQSQNNQNILLQVLYNASTIL